MFSSMGYDGPRRVEMTEVMGRNSAQALGNMLRESRSTGDNILWEDFQASFLEEYQPNKLRKR